MMTPCQAGRLGGLRTLALYGREHFRELGRRGFAALVLKRYAGDRKRCLDDLIERGLASGDPCPWNRSHQGYRPFGTTKEGTRQ